MSPALQMQGDWLNGVGLAVIRERLFIYFLNQISGTVGQLVVEHSKLIFKLRILINFK